MRTFETMKTPPTRELADVQPRARLAHNPVKSHTHVQHSCGCLHVDTGRPDGC
jgi:hypothetical protein